MELIKGFYRASTLRKIVMIIVLVWLCAYSLSVLSKNSYPRGYTEDQGGLLILGCKPSGKSYIFKKEEVAFWPIPHLEELPIKIYHYTCSNISFDMLAPYPDI